MSDKARGQSTQKDRPYVSPRSSGSHGAQIKSKRYSAEGKRRRPEPCEEDYDSEAEYLNFDKLKKFHIPRKKSHEERDILSELSMESREYTHTIYPTFRSSFFDQQASRKITIHKVETIRNHKLEKEYLAKKKDLKDEGRSDKEVSDSFGYLHYLRRSEVENICRDGVMVGHSNLASLGKPNMGVYISKHADIVRFTKWEDRVTGYIIMLKIMKGKTKVVMENRSPVTEQEPTPLYDCHIAKIPIDVAQSSHSRAFIGFQYYLYEYGHVDIVERPRQVLPYAVLKYSYNDAGSSVGAAGHSQRRESLLDDASSGNNSSTPLSTLSSDSGFCHWRGKLLVKSGTFCSVEIRSHIDTVFNVASIDRNINVKSCLSLEKLSRHLPPTMMSRSAKKYNVIYRGRHYNTFTLHPMEEGSGLGKFRQLIALLVQESAVAFVPLRNNSTMFLLPMSEFTESLGLVNYSPETIDSDPSKHSSKMWKNFLHIIIITPKVMSSKINDQRVFNIVHARKRKDPPSSQVSSTLKDGLEAKLRMMNIDPFSALSSMEQNQYQKIYDRIKNKKRVQNSEKMLHTHYKETDSISTTSKAIYVKNLATTWSEGTRQQQEFYYTKKKLKVIPSPKHSRSLSKSSDGAGDVAMDDHQEATFSDDDDAVKTSETQKKKYRYEDPRGQSQDPRYQNREDPRLSSPNKPTPMPYLPLPVKPPVASGTTSSILRPSFKPLEELIFCGQLQELLQHPEFSFSETYCLSHKVEGYISTSFTSWDKSHPPMKISFPQIVPYKLDTSDCPYAFENDPIVLSMLRAIHGEYNSDDDSLEDHDKVEWVRRVLHDHSVGASAASLQSADLSSRKIESNQKSSPQFTEASPHPSSTDSGFVSSSTPGNPTVLDAVSPSLKDIASILATALSQTQATEHVGNGNGDGNKNQGDNPDMELAAKALLEVLAHSQKVVENPESRKEEDLDGVDMELGSTPEEPLAKLDSVEIGTPYEDQSQEERTAEPCCSTKSPLPQGKATVGKGLSHLPQPLLHLQLKTKSSQEKALMALQRIKPGCTMNLLQDIIRKMALKVKEMKQKVTTKIAMTNTVTHEQISKRKESQGGQTGVTIERPIMIKPTTMATKENTKTDVMVQSTGMIAEKAILRGNPSQGRGEQNTENQTMSGIISKRVNPPVTIGIDQWKVRRGSGTTDIVGRSAYSAIDPRKAPMKNFMTNRGTTNVEDTRYLATAPLNISGTTMMKSTRLPLGAGRSSRIQTMTRIKPTVNPTAYQTSMYYEVGPPNMNQFPNMYQGPGPFYPTQVPVAHPHYLVPVPPPHIQPYHRPEITAVGGNIGFPNSMNSLGAISKQNTELLNSIIALMNGECVDPRNKRSVPSGQTPHRPPLPAQLQPADIAKLMPQINDLLVRASAASPSTKSSQDSSVKSPVFQTGTLGTSLSTEDIMRIREKKERMKAKRKSEQELCRREAMYMREELNKHLELEGRHKHAKKHKSSHQPYTSPASSTHSGEGHSDKHRPPKPTTSKSSDAPYNLDQSTIPKVLQSVAAKLASPSSITGEGSAPENETSSRPTGIATPNPRPVHPIFMESRTSFPLTESTSAQQSAVASRLPAPANRNAVISEIDQTLSVLKREMQTNRDNIGVKDSMSKLLQLVIKLGGATPQDDQSDTTDMTGPDSMVHRFSEDRHHSGEISNQTSHSRAPELSERTDRILNPAETPKDAIPFISDDPVIPFISDGSTFLHQSSRSENMLTDSTGIRSDAMKRPDDTVIPFISDDSAYSHGSRNASITKDKIEEFPLSISTGAGKYSTRNIDELLSKVKPAIETINRIQSFSKSDNDKNDLQDASSVGEKIQVIGSVPKMNQKMDTSTSQAVETAHSLAKFTSTPPSALVTIVRPRPVSLTNIQPILSLAKDLEPMAIKALNVMEPSVNTAALEQPETATQPDACHSTSNKSDRGTPTLDERYPELAVDNSQSKNEAKSNPFHVFNPDRSIECETISRYLESVHGVHVDIKEVFGKLCDNLKAMDMSSLDTTAISNQYNVVLPVGTLWVVLRSDDVSRLHLVPSIALLKAAGSRVQFVCANGVRDVRMRRYRGLFTGDGGIIVPLRPRTVLSKSDTFRHLLMWLVGQGKNRRSKNRWRLGLHQHILNALHRAQESENDIEQSTAQRISEWVCHANDVKPRVLIELQEHHCDSVPSTKVAGEWNSYDRVSDDRLAKLVFRCALKMQQDRADQLRHVVLLIDGDPGASCWHAVWQCGICVANVEDLTEQMCSKEAGISTHSWMSCVLPLYKKGLPCLVEKFGKSHLEI